jgi:hypothetical protein
MKSFSELYENVMSEGLKGDKNHIKLIRELGKAFTSTELSEDIPQYFELELPSDKMPPSGNSDDVWAQFWTPYIAEYMLKNNITINDLKKEL